MTMQISKWVSYYLFLTMVVSSFVSFEPAPYDLLMIGFIAFGFLFSFNKITKELVFPIVIVCIFLVSNLISLFFVKEMGGALFFTGITFYLAFTWIALVGMKDYLKPEILNFILKGFLVSACLSAIIGILAYFQLIPSSDEYLLFGRPKALFKDPNVFGPFLVVPTLFAISMTELRGTSNWKKSIYLLLFFLLIAGVLLSFSRAAWGNFVISFTIYILGMKKGAIGKRIRTILFLAIVGVPALIYFIQMPAVEDLFSERLGYQNYDNDRFDTQKQAIQSGISNPIGVGGGQAGSVLQYEPHSLYARVFAENGVLGLLSFFLLFLMSTHRVYKSYLQIKSERSVFYLIIFASLIGIGFNSFFVDTLHWRHFWLLLGLAWFPGIGIEEKEQKIKNRK